MAVFEDFDLDHEPLSHTNKVTETPGRPRCWFVATPDLRFPQRNPTQVGTGRRRRNAKEGFPEGIVFARLGHLLRLEAEQGWQNLDAKTGHCKGMPVGLEKRMRKEPLKCLGTRVWLEVARSLNKRAVH